MKWISWAWVLALGIEPMTFRSWGNCWSRPSLRYVLPLLFSRISFNCQNDISRWIKHVHATEASYVPCITRRMSIYVNFRLIMHISWHTSLFNDITGSCIRKVFWLSERSNRASNVTANNIQRARGGSILQVRRKVYIRISDEEKVEKKAEHADVERRNASGRFVIASRFTNAFRE